MAVDPNINLQDFARILNQISRQSNTLSSNVKDVSDILANFKSPLSKYEDYIKNIRDLGSDEVKRRADLVLELKKVHEEQKKVSANKKREIAKLEEDIKSTANARRRANAEVKKLVAKYGEFAEITEGPKEKAQQLKNSLADLKKQLKAANSEQAQYTHRVNRLGQIIQLREKELANVSFAEAGKKLFNRAGKTIVDGIQKLFSVKTFSETVSDVYKNTKREINTGVEVASMRNGIFHDDFALAKMGTDRAGAIEAAKRNRAAYLAAGGMKQSHEVIAALENSVKHVTTLDERFDYAADQLSVLAQAGIKPTVRNATLLTSSFVSLQKTAGLTAQEFNGMMMDLASDADVQSQLRIASNQAEREAILKGIAARTAENRQMGLTLEQAKAISKANARQANDPALKRIGDAARMQGLMGAMGISGGERMAQLMRKKTRTAAEDREYTAIMHSVNAQAQNMRTFDIRSELLIDALGKGLDTGNDKVTDPNSVYSKQFAESIRSTKESVDSLGDVSKELKGAIETFIQATKMWQAPAVQMGAAGVSSLGAIGPFIASATGSLVGGAAMYQMMKNTKMFGGAGAPAAGTSTAAGGTGVLAKGKAFLGKGSVRGGIAGVIAGTGLGYAADSFREHGHTTTGNLTDILGSAVTGAGTGAMVGSAVGGLGAIPGAVLGGLVGAGMKAYDIYGGSSKTTQPATEAAATSESNTLLQQQLSKMDKGNEYLQKLADAAPKMVELQEKQLQAMMLSDKERNDQSTKMRMLSNSRFTPRYGYIF